MATSGSHGAMNGLPSRAWSCDTLTRGLSFVVQNASMMQLGDFSNLPADELAAQLEATVSALVCSAVYAALLGQVDNT